MKNVRLFAVAAAMGMFASTVAAAETTKPTYVATWGEMTQVVKIDVNDKVVAPAASVKVVKEQRTDALSLITTSDSLGLPVDYDCYVGWTDEIVEDTNGDGWVDEAMLFNKDSKWISNNAKFFPSAKTALHYMGVTDGSSVLGGRFLAPGQDEKEFWATDLGHTHFEDEEAVVNYLIEKGNVELVRNEDEDLVYAVLNTLEITDSKGRNTAKYEIRLTAKDNRKSEDKIVEAIANIYWKGLDEYLAGATYFDGKTKMFTPIAGKTVENDYFKVEIARYDYTGYISPTHPMSEKPYHYFGYVEANEKTGYTGEELLPGGIYEVEEHRGELNIVKQLNKTIATDTDLVYFSNGKALQDVVADYGDFDKIYFVVENDSDYFLADGTKTYSTYTTTSIKAHASYSIESEYVWDSEAHAFVLVTKAAETVDYDSTKFGNAKYDGVTKDGKPNDASEEIGYYWNHPTHLGYATLIDPKAELDIMPNAMGLMYLETPENESDKIVIWHELGVGVFQDYELNAKDGTVRIKYYTDEAHTELLAKYMTLKAVKLDNGWYPAVDTEEELAKAMAKIADLRTVAGRYVDFDGDGVGDDAGEQTGWFGLTFAPNYLYDVANPISGLEGPEATRTLPNGEKEASYVPENSLQHYAGTFCTYKTADSEEVAATVTNNASEINTTVAGAKTLVYTAKVGEEVVGTKEVTVVVAPKYERTYKNGKVVTLKAFHLNGNLYAVYSYDWSAKTYNVTYYAEDGVTVAQTANGTL